MKTRIGIILCLSLLLTIRTVYPQNTSSFNRSFLDKTMRVDYYHTGTKGQETFSLDHVYEEGTWPGSKADLIDTLNFGEYLFKVIDVATNVVIYSRGYSTMFNEWQTTDEATGESIERFLRQCASRFHTTKCSSRSCGGTRR